jgi:hypothetical protein
VSAISSAAAPEREQASGHQAISRECERYGLDLAGRSASGHGADAKSGRRWWDGVIVASAVSVFLWLGLQAQVPPLAINAFWTSVLGVLLVCVAMGCGWLLWKRRFE